MVFVVMMLDELGDVWCDNCVDLLLNVVWNGKIFGCLNGYEMFVGFYEFVVYVVYLWLLFVGIIIGFGMVLNVIFCEIGLVCIVECCGIEVMDIGVFVMLFMFFGDWVYMECCVVDDSFLFGVID